MCHSPCSSPLQGSCTFEYLPLKVGEMVAKLTLSANELGVYQYELRLTATASPPEKAVHFLTALGSGATHVCRFTSFAKGRTEYSCKVHEQAGAPHMTHHPMHMSTHVHEHTCAQTLTQHINACLHTSLCPCAVLFAVSSSPLAAAGQP